MKINNMIAACLAFGVQPYSDDWLDSLFKQERIKPAQSDEDKTYYLNKAEEKRNRKNMKRISFAS